MEVAGVSRGRAVGKIALNLPAPRPGVGRSGLLERVGRVWIGAVMRVSACSSVIDVRARRCRAGDGARCRLMSLPGSAAPVVASSDRSLMRCSRSRE